ncbi:tetratricopeptide repeat protein [Neptunitalea chrysea]|nr:tetratricopeptide repeat protein [Neptunitalea chrysea]
MRKLVFILVLLIGSFGFAQKNDELFKEATNLYNSGKYEEAITAYETILKSGEHSAALYYNLANAHYKLSHIGPSIYYYEKALQLSPDDEDINNNIAFARNMTVDAIESLPLTGWQKFKINTVGIYTFDEWAVSAVVCVFLFVILITAYFLAYTSWRKRLFFVLGFVMLFGAIATVYFAHLQYVKANNSKYAIIYTPEVEVTSEPNEGASTIFVLHEGTKVKITDSLNAWKEIKLEDGKVGWLRTEDIKKL